jgi:hypothetical protein
MSRELVALVVLAARSAAADRSFHGGAAAGGTLLVTGSGGDRGRAEVQLDVEPGSVFGGLVAWRGFDRGHRGIIDAGLVYEAGAARPRLVLDLHADLGADLDQRAPVVGGGVRTVIAVVGPLGVALDLGGYLVVDGVDRTRLVIATSALLVARW